MVCQDGLVLVSVFGYSRFRYMLCFVRRALLRFAICSSQKRCVNDMKGKREKKIDLLDLPIAERKRLCFEIRAALRERVYASSSSFPDDMEIASRILRRALPMKASDEWERNHSPRRSAVRFSSVPKKP